MVSVNNLNDLNKWVKSQQGQNSVLDEKYLRKILTEAGKELEKYLIDELNSYFASYEPTHPEYRRGLTVKSIRVGEPKKTTINEWSLEIFFDPSIANHPSVFGGNQPDGYTPWLLNAGWRTKLDSTLNKENFTRFKGTNYITKAVNRFNQNNKHDLKVQVFHGSQDVTGKYWTYGQ
jgi:hypothetical protein